MKLLLLALLATAAAPLVLQEGYRDTPYLPGGKWRVHDADRPVPAVVTPSDEPGGPPSDATILFDGSHLEAWKSGDEIANWDISEGGVLVVNGTGTIETVEHFGDCQLHLEWRAPTHITGAGQGRGNSGVFFFGRYEIQILDSYENRTYADGQAGALYGQTPPLRNASRAPGKWQTYDIVFRAPRFAGTELVSPARATLFHNGVCVQDAVELIGATAHRAVAQYSPHGPKGPIALQDHGNPIQFQNIWVRPLED